MKSEGEFKQIIRCYLRGILVFCGIFVVALATSSTDQFKPRVTSGLSWEIQNLFDRS